MLEDLRRVLRMDSPAPRLSESNLRKLSRGLRSSKKSRLSVNSALETHSVQDESICNRSVSLSNLLPTISPTGMVPRVDKLQSLEAKMASIEMSLGWRIRREALLETLPRSARDLVRELDSLHQSVKEKDVTIVSLRSQITKMGGGENGNVCESGDLSDTDKQKMQDRLKKVQAEMDTKKVAVKNLTLTLDKIDITDNIDVRIRAAELEYELEREELNIINLKEETNFLTSKLQENSSSSSSENGTLNKNISMISDLLFPSAIPNPSLGLNVFETSVSYTTGNPPFHVTSKPLVGCVIDWATDDTRLKKGDRIIEMNGEMVSGNSLINVTKFMSSSSVLSLVIARSLAKSESALSNKKLEMQLEDKLKENKELVGRLDKALRERDYQKNENTRLNHRISYLEDQVSELQESSDTIEPHDESSAKSEHGTPTLPGATIIQVYQRGPETIAVSNSNKCLSNERLNGIVTSKESRMLAKRSESYDGLNTTSECASDTTSTVSATEPKHERDAKQEHHLPDRNFTGSKENMRNSAILDYIQKNKSRSSNFLFPSRKRAKEEVLSASESLYNDEGSEIGSEYVVRQSNQMAKERLRESMGSPRNSQDYLTQKTYKRNLFHQHDLTAKNAKYGDRRPVPPKKPERLSLQRTISLQSVEDVRPPSRISTHSGNIQSYKKSPLHEPIYGEIRRNSENANSKDGKNVSSSKYRPNGHPMPPPRTTTANLSRKVGRISEVCKEETYSRNNSYRGEISSKYDNYRRPNSPDASFHLDVSTDDYTSRLGMEQISKLAPHRQTRSFSPYAERQHNTEYKLSENSFRSGPPTPNTPPRGLLFTTPPRKSNTPEWC